MSLTKLWLFLIVADARSASPLQVSTEDDETTTATLFDRIGGEPALSAAVDGLYDRLVADEKLMTYFRGVDMETLRGHQYKFMQIAFTEIPKDLDIAEYLTKGHARLWDMVRAVSKSLVSLEL